MNPSMPLELRQLLEELYAEGEHNDASTQDRRHRMLNLEPDTARFMSIVVRSSRRKRIVEIGTSNGYSTIWLAWATQPLGGHIVSIDREAHKHELAAANLQRAGLRGMVDLRCGDATTIVADLTGPFDMVFFDADRRSAPAQLQLLIPKLAPDALLMADNVLSHPDEIAGYLAELERLSDFERIIVPVGKGLSIAYRYGA